jgi:hypothetical protein
MSLETTPGKLKRIIDGLSDWAYRSNGIVYRGEDWINSEQDEAAAKQAERDLKRKQKEQRKEDRKQHRR